VRQGDYRSLVQGRLATTPSEPDHDLWGVEAGDLRVTVLPVRATSLAARGGAVMHFVLTHDTAILLVDLEQPPRRLPCSSRKSARVE
jgi:hypothetical protein